MKRFIAIGLALVVLSGSKVYAASNYISDTEGTTTDVTTIQDPARPLYVGGNSVILDAPAMQDVFAAGDTVSVKTSVGANVFAAGSTVNLQSDIKESARVIAGTIKVTGTIEQDFSAAGQSITIEKGATVRGDTHLAGQNISIDGTVTGDVYVAAQSVKITGAVGGTVYVRTEALEVADTASLAGDLHYSSSKEGVITPGAVKGKVLYTEVHKSSMPKGPFTAISVIAGLIMAVLLWTLAKNKLVAIGTDTKHYLRHFGIGLAFLFLTPIAALILCLTIVGFPIGFILFGLYFLGMYLSFVIGSFYLGMQIMNYFQKDKKTHPALTFILGMLLLVVVGKIPVIGSTLTFVVRTMAMGAILSYDWMLWNKMRKAKDL